MRHYDDSGGGLARGILIGAVVAVVVMLALPVVAAVGSSLVLGQGNTADAVTSLSGAAATNLRITNTQAGSSALDLRVAVGSPPLKVNSTTRVPNLNADRLDGKHAGSFLLANGKAADASLLDGLDSTAFSPAGHHHDASYLGVIAAPGTGNFPTMSASGQLASSPYGPGSFLGATATAANSDHLDNLDATDLMRAAGNQSSDLPDMNGSVLTASINAPAAGYLIITASMSIGSSGSTDDLGCSLREGGVFLAGTWRMVSVGPITFATCATNVTYQVLGAGLYTVDLAVELWDNAALNEGSLSVLYVPFGPSGT